jgi:hypothetical protein
MKTIKFLLTVLCAVVLVSCSKKDHEPTLPSGENTAYYYLNGGLVVPKGFTAGVSFIKPISANICIQPNNAIVFYFNNSTEYFQLYIKPGVVNTGLQVLSAGGSNSACDYNHSFAFLSIRGAVSNPSLEFTTVQNSGEVNITKISADKRKFSGTFKATLYDANGQKVEITGGVFDINLDTL